MSEGELKTYTVRGLSFATGIPEWRIYQLAKRGLPHFRVGTTLRFRATEVLKFMQEQETHTRKES